MHNLTHEKEIIVRFHISLLSLSSLSILIYYNDNLSQLNNIYKL